MTDDLNDDLSDLLTAASTGPALAPIYRAPDGFKPAVERFSEGCPKCRGSGKFVSYSGRVLGDCFACKGQGGKTFKSSPEARAKARDGAQARKARADAELTAQAAAYTEAHSEAILWCIRTAKRNAERAGTFDFPQKMIDALAKFGCWTDNQLAAVERLAAKDVARAAERAAAAPAVDVSRIEAAFASAREKAARPGQMGVWVKPLHLRAGSTDVTFQPGSTGSQWEGMIFVKQGDRKLGHIKGGKFARKFACTDADQDAILAVAADPAQAAIAYGKAWSVCAVCSQTLTNDESIARGIGPICFGKMGW